MQCFIISIYKKKGVTLFFGKKPAEPEKVSIHELEALALSSFEHKSGNLEARAEAEILGMRNSVSEFLDACASLDVLDAEPYVQDLYFPNIASLKSQKSSYAKALRHTMDKIDLTPGRAQTTYDRYNELLSKVDDVTNEVLGVNATFKTIMYCYANHLARIKRSFSTLERHREALRTEISRRAGPASEYSRISERISALKSLIEESKALKEAAAAFNQDKSKDITGKVEAEEASLLVKISEKKLELPQTELSLSKLSANISKITLPLERPSRKLDHITVRKRLLYPMITDPMSNITNKEAYVEFVDLVKELKKNIEAGSIDIKNKESTLDIISETLNSDLYSMLVSFKALQQKHSDIEREIMIMEGALAETRKGKISLGKSKEEVRIMETKSVELSKSINPTKQEIEAMFMEYYRKQILILL